MNERIKAVRKDAGLTQEKFGNRIGITGVSCCLLESGKNKPSDQTILSICREFGVSEEWLRTGEGEMHCEVPEAEKLAAFIGDISLNKSDEFKRRMVCILADLDEEDWKLLEKLAEKIVASRKKEETL